MMNRKHILIPIGILVVSAILMFLLISLKKEAPKRTPTLQPKAVQVEVVELKDVKSEIIAFGRLTSSQPVLLYSEVTGILEKGSIPFLPATVFKKGDLLIKVDDRQAKLDLNSLKSDFLNALASVLPEIKVDFPDEYQKYQRYFDNCNFKSRLNKLPETSNQKIKLFLTRFNVYKLYYSVFWSLFTASVSDDTYTSRITQYPPITEHAPAVKGFSEEYAEYADYYELAYKTSHDWIYIWKINWDIISADLRIASTVRAGSMIGHIINLENLEVEAPVATNDVHWIDRTKSVLLTSSEIAGEWKGRITRIGKNIDERTQTVQLFVGIEKNGQVDLINGIFLKAIIPGRTIPNAVSVPNRAVYNESYVYLVQNGKLEYKQVKIARRQMDSVIVSSGIATGDTLVTELLQGVASGMPAVTRINGQ